MKGIVGALLLVFLFPLSCVQGKRVIRAAEQAEKTGAYIVKLRQETRHNDFEQTLQKAQRFSVDQKVPVRNEEGPFKFFTMKLAEEALDQVCMVHACNVPVGDIYTCVEVIRQYSTTRTNIRIPTDSRTHNP